MIWTADALNKLVKTKFTGIIVAIPLLPRDFKEQTMIIEKVWHEYCMSVGIRMNIVPDQEPREDLPPPGKAMFLPDGTVRIMNIWGDKYIDMPEEFAERALILGFLP